MSTTGERGLAVLSLDGGGIRGLSSLLILQEVMKRLQHQLGLDKPPEVYEHFDIIGGTGTGGISAVMLGRLRIPLDKAIEHFVELSEGVFSKASLRASKTDRSEKMQRALKTIIQEATQNENEMLMDDRPDTERCNTVVFAMAKHNMRLPRAFRSYQAWVNQMSDCAIWEALCATTAHPDLFESVNIRQNSLEQPFVDGGLGCNNPLPHILAEVKHMYPDRSVGCVISIGTGHAEMIQISNPAWFELFPNNVIGAMRSIAMDCERNAQEMATRFNARPDVYFRLNVTQGMQTVELDNWERMSEVAQHTQGYMQDKEVTPKIDGSVKAIKNKDCVFPALNIDGELPVSTNQSQDKEIDTRMNSLLLATDAWYNSALSDKMSKRTECTPNTRTKILADAHTWTRARDAAKIYWMNGMAGTGKTTIAYSLCKRLEKHKQLGASFFCSRESPTCREVTKLVPTIAYQLGHFSNIYGQVVCNVLVENRDVVYKDVETQFVKLIVEPLRPLKNATPRDVVVVIDALDECIDVNGTKQVLDLLFRYATELPIKFFVTSRPEPGIFAKMTQQNLSPRLILHLHDIEQSLVQADIHTYLTEALAPIRPPIPTDQIAQLTTQAGRLFIFAATVVRYISPDDESADHDDRLLTMLSTTANDPDRDYLAIDELYSVILLKAFEGGTAKEKELRRRVLRTVVCARETMTMSALAEILGAQNERKVQLAIMPLRSVLHVSQSAGVVSTFHASFPDFLLSEERAGTELCCNKEDYNSYLTTRCFDVMENSLRFNICGLETSSRFDRDVLDLRSRIDSAITSGLFYACRYWGDHLLSAGNLASSRTLLNEFLRCRLLFWMEVLNLKGCISRGEGILSQVFSWLPMDYTETELRQFTYDARNFVTTFAANPTSLSTPHIYLSVLPFTSTQSLVRTNYWPKTRGLLRVEGTGMEARGRTALATWNVGFGVVSIAQSGDGKRIVSGCSDGTVSIWDVSKGARIVGPLQSGERGGWVLENDIVLPDGPRVAFSFDGTRIASGSRDCRIRIWGAHNGKPITHPITGHTKPVLSLAFSPDGTRLISGSADRTILMWDAQQNPKKPAEHS